jgi:hypothetical protein
MGMWQLDCRAGYDHVLQSITRWAMTYFGKMIFEFFWTLKISHLGGQIQSSFLKWPECETFVLSWTLADYYLWYSHRFSDMKWDSWLNFEELRRILGFLLSSIRSFVLLTKNVRCMEFSTSSETLRVKTCLFGQEDRIESCGLISFSDRQISLEKNIDQNVIWQAKSYHVL